MTTILDIDLDYFNLSPDPEGELQTLLTWASRPVDLVVEQHHHALYWWERVTAESGIATPTTIMHVDEHHDLMSDAPQVTAANFMVAAMQEWSTCEVLWVTPEPIDWPDLWLDEETWQHLQGRFRWVPAVPTDAPRPDLVTVCTSPGFLTDSLSTRLLGVIQAHGGPIAVCRRVSRPVGLRKRLPA
jgi:hypothetical protein